MGEADEDELPTILKPVELLALHDVTGHLFCTLQRWFSVPPSISLDLSAIDAAVCDMGDPVKVMALAMRKLQALHLLSTPGVRTTTDVVVTIVQDLQRALLQAPVMRLRAAAEATDWDQAFERIFGDTVGDDCEGCDPEVEHYAEQCGLLLDAMRAVVRVSGGRIRVME